MIETTNLSYIYIYIDSFNHPSSKSVKDIIKVFIKCAAAFKALGPVHFALQLCENGELRRHVGRGAVMQSVPFVFFFFLIDVIKL